MCDGRRASSAGLYRRRAADARHVPRRGLCCTIDATPIRNAIPKITTGHQVPVIPEIAQNTVTTPSTAVIHFRRCHVMPSSFRVGEMTLGSSAIRLCSFRLTRGRLSTPPGWQQPHGRGPGGPSRVATGRPGRARPTRSSGLQDRSARGQSVQLPRPAELISTT
jgi:hypothetical protein